MILAFLMIPALNILHFMLKFVKCKKDSYIERKKKGLSEMIYWGYPITTVMEGYSVLCMCAFINLISFINLTNDARVNRLSTFLTYFFLVLLTSFPIVVWFILVKNWR